MDPKKPKEPQDFCVVDTPKESRLSHFEWLSIHGGDELGKAVDWVAKQFKNFTVAHETIKVDPEIFLRAKEFYSQFLSPTSNQISVPTFFENYPAISSKDVTLRSIHGLADGEVVDGYFVSQYQSRREDLVEKLVGANENRHVRFRMWRRTSGVAKGTVVAVHGWTMGDQRLNSLAFLPGRLFLAGYNVVLPELPFHGRRAPKGGTTDNFPSPDPFLTNEAMGQTVCDLRALIGFLRNQQLPKVGIIGFSLGAYVTALISELDPDLNFSIPLMPLVSMSETAWGYITKDQSFSDMKANGLTPELVDEVYKVHCPLMYNLRVPKDRVMIVGGVGDEMVPTRQTKLLHEHWGRPNLRWLDGGHSAHLRQTRGMKIVEEALGKWC